jgi:hypothetical protein
MTILLDDTGQNFSQAPGQDSIHTQNQQVTDIVLWYEDAHLRAQALDQSGRFRGVVVAADL